MKGYLLIGCMRSGEFDVGAIKNVNLVETDEVSSLLRWSIPPVIPPDRRLGDGRIELAHFAPGRGQSNAATVATIA